MNPRLTLVLVAIILIGGAAALWLGDRATPIVPPPPTESSEPPSPPDEPLPPPQDYVLAISWHAAFCETKPNLPECREASADDYTATHFALHGLWPQDDEYCGVGERLIALDEANRWDDLPEIDVSNATWRELVRIMPGTQDSLERHEWVFHGSCSGVSAERYFQRSIALTEEINRSAIRDLLAANVGKRLTSAQVRAAFDEAFGNGAGRRVRLDCERDGNRELLYELRINLGGDVMAPVSLRDLLASGRTTGAGCSGGVIDRVGTQ